MATRSEFERLAHDALAHLYDVPYLQNHPLTRWLPPAARSESPGRVLRRLLLDTIQEMKLPFDVPHDNTSAARYQFLYLRYVRAASVDEVAKQFALSERQLYRRQRDALEAFTATFGHRLGVALVAEERSATAEVPSESAIPRTSHVESEVDRLGSARGNSTTDILQVVQGAVSTVAQIAKADGRAIQVDIGGGIQPVAADRVAIRQAILALLMFAIEAPCLGPIRISVDGSRASVNLEVRFPIHSRGEGSSSPVADSNLAVSQRLFELQGGSLRWSFSAGKWQITATLATASPRTILIVDDNLDTLQLFSRYLEFHGFQVLTATTGEEALRVAPVTHPDAIVLDVMLPSADGYEALQALRCDLSTAAIPVIVCTVLKQRELALSIGATDFLLKPVTQGDLLAALERCWTSYRAVPPSLRSAGA